MRLQEGGGEKFVGIRRRLAIGGPHCVQQIGTCNVRRRAQVSCDLREARGTVLLDNFDKLPEAVEGCGVGSCSASILLAGQWAGSPLDSRRDARATRFGCAVPLDALINILLKADHAQVEA